MSGSRLEQFVAQVKTLQLIVTALLTGCVAFLVVVLIVTQGSGDSPDPPMVTYIACGIASSLVLLRLIVPRSIAAQARWKVKQETPGNPRIDLSNMPDDAMWENGGLGGLAQAFVVRTIVAAAMIEGAIFLLLVAFMVERSPASLVFAVVLIVVLAGHIPPRSRAEAWFHDQMRLLNEERSF